jgi:hypothetical protein
MLSGMAKKKGNGQRGTFSRPTIRLPQETRRLLDAWCAVENASMWSLVDRAILETIARLGHDDQRLIRKLAARQAESSE